MQSKFFLIAFHSIWTSSTDFRKTINCHISLRRVMTLFNRLSILNKFYCSEKEMYVCCSIGNVLTLAPLKGERLLLVYAVDISLLRKI